MLKSNFIALRGAIDFFVASLVDPFLVDCIILHQYPSTDSTGKFHDIHGIQDVFSGFTPAAFRAKNISVTVTVMSSPSSIESSTFFFRSKLLIYCIGFFPSSDLKHITSYWWIVLFFIDLFLFAD